LTHGAKHKGVSQCSEADERAADREESLVDVREALEAGLEAAEMMEPGDSAFDGPAVNTELASVLQPATGEEGADAPRLQRPAMGPGIVGGVPVDLVRAAPRAAHPAAALRDRVDEGVTMRCTHALVTQSKRRAVGVGVLVAVAIPLLNLFHELAQPVPLHDFIGGPR
jgi:hypothetical protein